MNKFNVNLTSFHFLFALSIYISVHEGYGEQLRMQAFDLAVSPWSTSPINLRRSDLGMICSQQTWYSFSMLCEKLIKKVCLSTFWTTHQLCWCWQSQEFYSGTSSSFPLASFHSLLLRRLLFDTTHCFWKTSGRLCVTLRSRWVHVFPMQHHLASFVLLHSAGHQLSRHSRYFTGKWRARISLAIKKLF